MGRSGSGAAAHGRDPERELLGGMLAAKDIAADAAAALEPRDFISTRHCVLFEALQALVYANGNCGDLEQVTKCLEVRGLLAQVGGPEYLRGLLACACGPQERQAVINAVRGAGVLRRLEQAAAQIGAQARAASPSEADDTFAMATRCVAEALNAPGGYAPLCDVMEGTLDEIESTANRCGRMTGVPTGFADLDSLTQGFHPGQLIVVASRPAMGKSNLGLCFARSCSIANNLTSVIFALDGGRNELTMRLLSAESRVALHHMRSGSMTDDDWARLARCMGEMAANPLFIDDTADLTFTQVRARCRRLRERHDLRLAIVDTINMMTYGTRPFDNRYLEISEIARCLKQLAKELEIPIIAISQLNRGPEQRVDRRPALHDLRDAGTLEDNADVVILLHRESAYDPESPRQGEADLTVAKHRQGPTATITVAYQGHYSRFVDLQQPSD